MALIQANVDMDVGLWKRSGKGNKRPAPLTAYQSYGRELQFPWPQDYFVLRCPSTVRAVSDCCYTMDKSQYPKHHGGQQKVGISLVCFKYINIATKKKTKQKSVAKLLFVVSAVWNWPQEPLLTMLISAASPFWGPRKTKLILANWDTGTQYGHVLFLILHAICACETDSQLCTALNNHSLQKQLSSFRRRRLTASGLAVWYRELGRQDLV